jgi:hypothetical protein
LAFSFEGKNKRKVQEEEGCKSQPSKDHPYAKDSVDRVDAVDHDDFAYVPGRKGKDKAGKEPMSCIFRIAGKHDETQGEVHRKGKRRR